MSSTSSPSHTAPARSSDRAHAEVDIRGEIAFPNEWTLFASFAKDDPLPDRATLARVPESLTLGDTTRRAERITPTRSQFDLVSRFGTPPQCLFKTAYVFVPIHVERDTEATIGIAGDHWLQAWLNGEVILGEDGPDGQITDSQFPPAITNQPIHVHLKPGENVLAVRYTSGKGGPLIALGGPRELRAGDFRSLLEDPLHTDARWTQPRLQAEPREQEPIEIGTRRELFVDSFLIDQLTAAATRRLHHPVPREIVFEAGEVGRPWEGSIGYPTFIHDGDRIRMYYSGRPKAVADEDDDQYTCLAESTDGIHFTRPSLGLYEFQGSTDNNIIWRGRTSHNFSPFIDTNPDASADQRYKAIGYFHGDVKGLGAYASADGIHWRALTDQPIITQGAFDSHNLIFWDANRQCYVCYYRCTRDAPPGQYMLGGVRDIMTCTSEDFIHWTEPRFIDYADPRQEEMYTNAIRPYARAPHIYIGTPARFVKRRKKVAAHPDVGVSDAILMSSRDGQRFERWETGFVRPGPEPEVWTDRNNYPAWGMLQLSPTELSIYWNEHNKYPTKRLRRGTIRTDGFVSVHTPGEDVGELLTRPLIFSGDRLEVNYATSAPGAMMFELCDAAGEPIEGFTFADSEVLYGNELAHIVTWRGCVSDVGALAGKPVRLRVRMQDADFYSFRFIQA